MRNLQFAQGEHYHVYNRGVDKRVIFKDARDFERFLLSMTDFNSIEPIGSIYEYSFLKNESKKRENPQLGNLVSKSGHKKRKQENKPLVEFIAYCLNKNHFHFILKQMEEKGIEKFMHRLGVGFTKYFNLRYKRTGALFQGTFKAVHVESNEQLLYLSVYVNLNNKIHGHKDNHFVSSWTEYRNESNRNICNKKIILEQFKNPLSFCKDFESMAQEIKKRRYADDSLAFIEPHLET
ncbi:MAG: transposase [Patescibacteria group bacterium]